MKARHIVLASPRPVRAVMSLSGSDVSSSSRRASSMRSAAHQLGGRFAEVLAAPAAERARAHADPARDPLDRQRLVEVLEDERRDVAQLRRLLLLPLQRRAELRLIPRTAQEQHQPLGDRHRHAVAVVLLDQRQRQIDARGDPRRRPDAAVLARRCRRRRPGRREARAQLVEEHPVRGGAPAVEHAGRRQHEGARADRDDASGCARETGAARAPGARRPPAAGARGAPATIATSGRRAPDARQRPDARPRPGRGASAMAGARGPTRLQLVGGAAEHVVRVAQHLPRPGDVEHARAAARRETRPASSLGPTVRF